MTEKLQMYRCEVCGNFVQVFLSGAGELVCCGQPMKLITPNTTEDAAVEKHIPVFTKDENGKSIIQVGSTPHPMEDKHYIMLIETISTDGNRVKLKYLYPEMKPEIAFEKNKTGGEKALAYCNIHGLWEGKNDK